MGGRAAARAVLRERVDRRKFGRLRWLRKARELRSRGLSVPANLGYVLADPEVDNFTYDLGNDDELARWLAATLAADGRRLVAECRADTALRDRIDRAAATRPWSMKQRPGIGRRIGWYAIVRHLKPERVIETGTHDGLGSLVLLAALARNAAEGHEGKLLSLDIDPHAGWMVGSDPRFEPVIGPSDVTLPGVLSEPAGLFLHDSDHSAENERFELELAADAGVPVLLSDNSHVTDVLREVCEAHGGRYAFFRERPRGHFYPGGGIGLGQIAGH